MKQELKVNINDMQLDNDDYECLRQAIDTLFKSSEEQFTSIKKEKWYNRVFDMITFSKKNEKRLAEQVGNIAQAQQILLELLMRLSNNDKYISDMVKKCFVDINKVVDQNIDLKKAFNELERIICSKREDLNIKSLTENEKEILSACLFYISKINKDPSKEQQIFAQEVIMYIDKETQMENCLNLISGMKEASRRKVLACCMEYMFLNDNSFDNINIYNKFIEEFDFGKKTINSLKEQIISLYGLTGAEGFWKRYYCEEYIEIDESFFCDFETDIIYEDVIEEYSEKYEDIELDEHYISTITLIKKGEKRVINNKIVHISAFIKCEGELEFNNCIIYYNEGDGADKITLENGASLNINKSVVKCMGDDNSPFIKGVENNNVIIENSTLEECTHFIELRSCENIILSKCELKNCGEWFFVVYRKKNAKVEISDSIISYENANDKSGVLFDIHDVYHFGKSDNRSLFYNNIIIEVEKSKYPMTYVNSYYSKIYKCTFIGLYGCIQAELVKDCKFKNCDGALSLVGDNACVDDCFFENCTDVIKVNDNTKIVNCQFMNCWNNIIDGWNIHRGGVIVEYCHFINTRLLHNEYAAISLTRNNRKDSSENVVKKCIFDGAEVNNGFLIKADCFEKPYGIVTRVEECVFKNCTTQRSSGKIIKEYITYDTFFKNDISFHANIINNCQGLNKINKEASKTKETKKKKTNIEGKIIGSTMGTAIIASSVIPMGVVASVGMVAGVMLSEKVIQILKDNEDEIEDE